MSEDIYREYYSLIENLENLEKKHIAIMSSITNRFVKEVNERATKIAQLHEKILQIEMNYEAGH